MRQHAIVAKAITVRVDTRIQRKRSMLEDYTTRVFDLQFEDFVVACLVEIDCNALMQNTALLCFLIELVVAILMLNSESPSVAGCPRQNPLQSVNHVGSSKYAESS